MRVLVCDDLKDRCDEAVRSIGESLPGEIKITSLCGDDLKSALGKLFECVAARLSGDFSDEKCSKTAFDDADLVVVDNNLAHLDIVGTRLTAESIVGYIRAFTSALYIVSLNKNPEVDFDLRYLVGDFSTRADLAINDRHLANKALWTGQSADSENGFRPWYWPALSTIAKRRLAQVEFVRARLDQPVFAAMQFRDDALPLLSRHARGTLSPRATLDGGGGDASPIQQLTFRDVFLESSRSLPDKREREKLNTYSQKGSAIVDEVICRVAAADIDLWFRRDVLGPQEALVDLPHLLTRMPFLLGRRADTVSEWNAAARSQTAPFAIEKQLYDDHLAATKFLPDIWVPAPSFWWSALKDDEKLNELFFASDEKWGDVVFCEDRSEFVTRLPDTGEHPTEFTAEFEGSWSRRYVSRIEGVRYAPRSRFAV